MARRRKAGKLSRAEMDFRLNRLQIMAPWYGRAMLAVASAVPVAAIMWGLGAFAGETTDLQINAVIGVSVTANIFMAMGKRRQSNAMKDQSAELNRLRGRVEALDAGTLGALPPGRRGTRA